MIAKKPPMGWNSWNTFGEKINEELFMQTADAMIEKGYKNAGYEYLIIDDCWALRERVNGKLAADPKLFPHGMKYISDYVQQQRFEIRHVFMCRFPNLRRISEQLRS